jgi:hypothetical protein
VPFSAERKAHILENHKWFQVWMTEFNFDVIILFCTLEGEFALFEVNRDQMTGFFQTYEDIFWELRMDDYFYVTPPRNDMGPIVVEEYRRLAKPLEDPNARIVKQ